MTFLGQFKTNLFFLQGSSGTIVVFSSNGRLLFARFVVSVLTIHVIVTLIFEVETERAMKQRQRRQAMKRRVDGNIGLFFSGIKTISGDIFAIAEK